MNELQLDFRQRGVCQHNLGVLLVLQHDRIVRLIVAAALNLACYISQHYLDAMEVMRSYLMLRST